MLSCHKVDTVGKHIKYSFALQVSSRQRVPGCKLATHEYSFKETGLQKRQYMCTRNVIYCVMHYRKPPK